MQFKQIVLCVAAVALLGCGDTTSPAPLGDLYQLTQYWGQSLPVRTSPGDSAATIAAESIILTASSPFAVRSRILLDSAGTPRAYTDSLRVTRSNNTISIDFNCGPRVCPAVTAPDIAVLGGLYLRFMRADSTVTRVYELIPPIQ